MSYATTNTSQQIPLRVLLRSIPAMVLRVNLPSQKSFYTDHVVGEGSVGRPKVAYWTFPEKRW